LGPFQQSMSLEDIRHKKCFVGNEELTKDEIDTVLEVEEEYARKGNFNRVFPLVSNVRHYQEFFENRRYQNHLVSAYLLSPDHVKN
jgi:hypothetical protein